VAPRHIRSFFGRAQSRRVRTISEVCVWPGICQEALTLVGIGAWIAKLKCAAATAHSFSPAASGRRTRSNVAREELPHQAHCRAAAVERAHLHEAVRYSFHHV